MQQGDWWMLVTAAGSVLAAVGPWMLMVHARLAVLSAQVAKLDAKLDKLCDSHQDRLAWCVRHQAAIEEMQRQIEHQ